MNVIYSQWKLSNLEGDRKDKGRRNIKMGKEKLRNRSRGNTNRGGRLKLWKTRGPHEFITPSSRIS